MSIKINLNEVLKARDMKSYELANEIDITTANLSILKTGKAKAIRLSTLAKICEVLDCQPGDILVYEK
jgi:putative transcriptional regulator